MACWRRNALWKARQRACLRRCKGIMTETKNTGDKTIHVPQQRKPLGLKPRGVERDTVRQSFSHGRTNTVQVERKKRRIVRARREPRPSRRSAPPRPAPEPVSVLLEVDASSAAAARAEPARRAGAPPALRGRDRRPRQGARRRQGPRGRGAPRRRGTARRAAAPRPSACQRERAEAERRKAEEEPRRKAEEALRSRAEDTARRRLGEEKQARRPRSPSRVRGRQGPQRKSEAEEDDRGRGKAKVARPRRAEAGQARRGAPPRQADPGQRARRFRARPLARLDPPPPRARARPRPTTGPAREDHARGHHSRDDHHPGTRQPHGRARRGRDQAADEAGPAGQGGRRDRRRHRPAHRRGDGPQRRAASPNPTSRPACSSPADAVEDLEPRGRRW